MLITILLIIGWIFSLWGLWIAVFSIRNKSGMSAGNIIWASAGILFILWRCFPNFHL